MNDIELLFGILSSVKVIYENLDWTILPVDTIWSGSKVWKKKLFHESPVGSYWVQLNLSVSLNFAAQNIVAVNIIKD